MSSVLRSAEKSVTSFCRSRACSLAKGDLQPGEHVVAPARGAGDIRGYVFVVGETQVRIHDAVGGGEVALGGNARRDPHLADQ